MTRRIPYLLALAFSFAMAVPVAAALEPERERALGNLLVHDCGSCHGTRLRGGLGPPLTPDRMRHLPRDWIVDAILDGRRGTAMPPWRALLTPEDAAWLARSLQSGVVE